MSTLGQKQTCAVQNTMSALPESGHSRALYPANERHGRRGRMLKYSGPKITERPHKSPLLPVENSYAIFAFALPATGPRMG